MKALSLILSTTLITASISLAMSKKPVETKAEKNHFKAAGKSMGLFQVNVASKDNGNGDITLVGQVMPQKDLNQAEFIWKVPQDAKIISGELTGSDSFEAGKMKEITLVIAKESMKEKDQVFFFVYQNVNGERMGSTHSYLHKQDDAYFQKSETKLQKAEKPKKVFY